jgi:hypothetical protein
MPAPPFPGRTLKAADNEHDLVKSLQARLGSIGFGPLSADGDFGGGTQRAVLAFQTAHHLPADGQVDEATWKAIFEATAPTASPEFLTKLIEVAGAEVGVREKGGPNRGPRVDQYIREVGLDPTKGAFSWCAAFVYFCFQQTANALGVINPCVKTAGVAFHWVTAPAWAKVPAKELLTSPESIKPGCIYLVDHGGGKGHTGLIERATSATTVATIEGNTDDGGSREGDGVYRKERQIANINLGIIDYSRPQT